MRKIYFIAQTPTEASEYLKNYEPSVLDVDKNADVSGYKYIAILLSEPAVNNPTTKTISF